MTNWIPALPAEGYKPIYLALVAVLPTLFTRAFDFSAASRNFIGGTSLLILVGVGAAWLVTAFEFTGRRSDVIVVGKGNAALCSAVSAHEQGARVVMLEVASEEESGGNSRFAGGVMRFAYESVEDLKRVTELTDEEIANAAKEVAGKTELEALIAYLQSLGKARSK